MADVDTLMGIVGTSVDSEPVRNLIAADGLVGSTDPDLEEGEPIESNLANRTAGYELECQDGRVTSVFLYVDATNLRGGYSPFVGALPGGLVPSDMRPAVLRRFGVPQRSGKAFADPILGPQGAWDRYMVGALCIHFQYTVAEERIGQVTIMAADRVP